MESRYVFQDKYFGRKVTIKEFPSVLSFFLSNGAQVLSYHIPLILRQLYRLAAIVHRLDHYRFYAASLLFIYDGDKEVQETYKQSLVLERAPAGLGDLTEVADDDDLVLPPLATSPEPIPTSTGTVPLPRPAAPRRLGSHRLSSASHMRSPPLSASSGSTKKHTKVPGGVTVRLVDFAHCTTGDDFIPPPLAGEAEPIRTGPTDTRVQATFPPTHPNQPDLGFLLGLKSLCAALKMIWYEHGLEDGRQREELKVPGESIFEEIFGMGSLQQGLGEGPGPEEVWNLKDLVTA